MYVQEERLLTLFDVPIQLPQSMLQPGGWLAVATIQLEAGNKLDLRWLQLSVALMESSIVADPCGVAGQNVINSDFPAGSLAVLFIVKDWSPAAEPWTQTVIEQLSAPTDYAVAPLAIPPLTSVRSSATPLQVTEAGSYSFVVLNNTVNRNLAVSVSGAATVDTDPV